MRAITTTTTTTILFVVLSLPSLVNARRRELQQHVHNDNSSVVKPNKHNSTTGGGLQPQDQIPLTANTTPIVITLPTLTHVPKVVLSESPVQSTTLRPTIQKLKKHTPLDATVLHVPTAAPTIRSAAPIELSTKLAPPNVTEQQLPSKVAPPKKGPPKEGPPPIDHPQPPNEVPPPPDHPLPPKKSSKGGSKAKSPKCATGSKSPTKAPSRVPRASKAPSSQASRNSNIHSTCKDAQGMAPTVDRRKIDSCAFMVNGTGDTTGPELSFFVNFTMLVNESSNVVSNNLQTILQTVVGPNLAGCPPITPPSPPRAFPPAKFATSTPSVVPIAPKITPPGAPTTVTPPVSASAKAVTTLNPTEISPKVLASHEPTVRPHIVSTATPTRVITIPKPTILSSRAPTGPATLVNNVSFVPSHMRELQPRSLLSGDITNVVFQVESYDSLLAGK
jgi:hypothetical protein